MGIVGFGHIGRSVAKIAKGFDMKILAYDVISIKEPGVTQVDIEALFKDSDFITLHTPLIRETEKLINEKSIGLMKPTAVLINASRGKVVDEPALIQALKDNKIAGACLDVYEKEPLAADSELRKLDNCLLSPHLGYCSNEALAGRFKFFADNSKRLLDGEAVQMAVNADKIEGR